MSTQGISGIREKMDREFAAIRADLKRIEALATASQGAPKPTPRAEARLDRALALLRKLEWGTSEPGRRGHRQCPVCKSAEPSHADACDLASLLDG